MKSKPKKKKSGSLYMHTIDGRPAQFYDYDGQICFCYGNQKLIHFADSLEQIRKEQKKTKTFRLSRGYPFNESMYGWLKLDREALRKML